MKTYSLKSIRINAGLTLDEASALIGVSKSTLYNYEHFKTTPDNDIIKKIMQIYNVSYDDIRFLPTEKEKEFVVKK